MKASFTSHISELSAYIKDVDAKNGKEIPQNLNATKDFHPNPEPMNYF